MDIEWAKDGLSNELFITQARPETVHHGKNRNSHTEYKLLEEDSRHLNGYNDIPKKNRETNLSQFKGWSRALL